MSESELTMLGDAAPKAIQALIEALEAERTFLVGAGDNSRLETAPDHDARIKAANALLDRLYGKPAQTVSGDGGGPVHFSVDLIKTVADLAAKRG
jgi:cytosine/adenosine deaminase-related metal-dependent hydrolase